MRERWFGATGVRVPEIAVEGEDLEVIGPDRVRVRAQDFETLVLDEIEDETVLREAHLRGTPVVVRADDAGSVASALARPEVACVLVPPERAALRDLDLRRHKYG